MSKMEKVVGSIGVMEEIAEKDRSKLFPYFVEHRLKNLTEYIHEF